MNKRIWSIALVFVTAAVILYGCSKGSNGGESTDVHADFKIGMLTNYADNIIIPAYTDLQAKLDLLETSINAFLAAPSDATQQPLKASFKNAYLAYENIS